MVKSLVLFSNLQLVHSEWSFSGGQILFYLARIQDIQLLIEKFQKSLMSALHGGYCTFACITKNLGSFIFQGLCWVWKKKLSFWKKV